MSKWLREPLIHFLLLGGLIFVVYHSVAGKGSDADEIFISKGQQENLLNTFSRTWQRPPTPDEFQGLLQDYIRQEIAYRESRKMGLDQDDIVIRRRLRQKLEMLVEDVAALMPPNDEQLQAYLDEHHAEYMLQPQISLRQVYFSTDRRRVPGLVCAGKVQLAAMGMARSGVLHRVAGSLLDDRPDHRICLTHPHQQ